MGGGSGDFIVEVTAETTAIYTFAAQGYDIAMYARTSCTEDSTCIAGSDSAFATGTESFDVTLNAGEPVYVFIDGWSNNDDVTGDFTLTATLSAPACVPDCTDKDCGDDGCGNSCGECTDGSLCNTDGLCVEPPQGDNCSNPIAITLPLVGLITGIRLTNDILLVPS